MRAVVVCQEVELSRAGAEAGVVTEAGRAVARAVARAAEARAVATDAEMEYSYGLASLQAGAHRGGATC